MIKVKSKSSTIARLLRKGESLPSSIVTGFEISGIYPDWCWVIEHDGKIVACCLAMAGHGICFLLRIVATPDAPNYWFVVLLRKVLLDCKTRGCLGFTVYFESPKEENATLTIEQRLARICVKLNCMLIPSSGVWALGSMDIAERKGTAK